MINRRKFLEFLGYGTGVAATTSLLPSWAAGSRSSRLSSIEPSSVDDLVLASGFRANTVLKWNEALDALGQSRFGFNCDYLAFFMRNGDPNSGILGVNHEYSNPLFIHGQTDASLKTWNEVQLEMKNVGMSFVELRRRNGRWDYVVDSSLNRRIDAFTPIPMAWDEPVDGVTIAQGSLANCAGGVTPWGSYLSCEENYDYSFGEFVYGPGGRERKFRSENDGWQRFNDRTPEQYGWVVEVEPATGKSKKLVSLGRFAHEGATCVVAPDGRIVVYMGDDAAGECIYKFVSDSANSLERGELYVADAFSGRWISLNLRRSRALEAHFRTQTEVQIRLREAARIVGGTPQDRPEDIKIDPITGHVIVALTNNKKTNNFHGSLLKIEEYGGDPRSERFTSSVMLSGGEETGFACPDNLAFDQHGNLWITSDISSSAVGKEPYKKFLNNGLFVVPRRGTDAGRVIQVASAPVDAELTGPCFSPDGSTLFLSVQHPGEESKSLANMTSHWPDGGTSVPKPSVVAIEVPKF